MSLTIVDEPRDRPEWLEQSLDLVVAEVRELRARVLAMVATATDADLAAGTDEEWGIGQIATHLLLVERGVLSISLRLARGEAPGTTGQPRVPAAAVDRARILGLAEKVVALEERFARDFPPQPDLENVARHPYAGGLNCFGWLLTVPFHYAGHVRSLERGEESAL